MGLLVDKSDLNFGKRSWRYSMLVRDRKIEKMFIEPQKEGDPFEVSDADTMLDYINPKAKLPGPGRDPDSRRLPVLRQGQADADEAGYEYAEMPLPHTIRSKALGAIAKAQTVPQVFINGKLIGDSEKLEAWLGTRAAA